MTAFFDDYARVMADPDEPFGEERFVLMGRSERQRLLVVSHCYREADEVIRIISARPASRTEAEHYAGWLS